VRADFSAVRDNQHGWPNGNSRGTAAGFGTDREQPQPSGDVGNVPINRGTPKGLPRMRQLLTDGRPNEAGNFLAKNSRFLVTKRRLSGQNLATQILRRQASSASPPLFLEHGSDANAVYFLSHRRVASRE
jgi:hypothetical protein